jgi:1-acyl-sn-glycerol-3-phosphate acyltransferase
MFFASIRLPLVTINGLRLESRGAPPITERGLILLANHQAPLDFLLLPLLFPRAHIRYVARKGLDRFIPSLSYYLRNSGSVILSRRGLQERLRTLGSTSEANGGVTICFPEGKKFGAERNAITRFHKRGLETILAGGPRLLLVPVVIDLDPDRLYTFPLRRGHCARMRVLPPMENGPDVIEACEHALRVAFEELRAERQKDASAPAAATERVGT